MKWKDIQPMSKVELEKALRGAKSEMIDFRFKVSTGTLKQVHKINFLRKNIARMISRLSNLNEK